VQKSKLKNDCAEFYVTTQPGTPMELFVDPSTGTIIGGI
jgi:peptidase YpeB-like protein